MKHLPIGRGYQRSLVYLDGSNSYWDNTCTGWCPYTSSNKFTDLWEDSLPAWTRNNSWGCTQATQAGCTYEDDLFADFLVQGISAHANASQPLLTYFAPHSVHVASDPGLPLEAPDAALARFAFINDTSRQYYAAMVNTVDAQIGRIVDALKARGMWENTLVVRRRARPAASSRARTHTHPTPSLSFPLPLFPSSRRWSAQIMEAWCTQTGTLALPITR